MGIFGKKKKDENLDDVVEEKSEDLKIKLALTEAEQARMSSVQIEYLEDELSRLPKIEDGQINIASDYIAYFDGKIEAKVFIRNALSRKINFDDVCLGIEDENGKVIKQQKFNLAHLGDIPPYSAIVTKLFFEPDEINIEDVEFEKLKICFSRSVKAFKSVNTEFQSLPDNLTGEQIAVCNRYLHDLGKLELNTVSLSAVDALKSEDGNVVVTLIARNGYDRKAEIQELNISIFDKNDDKVAGGKFYFNDLKVLSKKARIFNLIFNEQNIIKPDCDLSKWRVSFNQ